MLSTRLPVLSSRVVGNDWLGAARDEEIAQRVAVVSGVCGTQAAGWLACRFRSCSLCLSSVSFKRCGWSIGDVIALVIAIIVHARLHQAIEQSAIAGTG